MPPVNGTREIKDIIHFLDAGGYDDFLNGLKDCTLDQQKRFLFHYKKLVELEKLFYKTADEMRRLDFQLNTDGLLKAAAKQKYTMSDLIENKLSTRKEV